MADLDTRVSVLETKVVDLQTDTGLHEGRLRIMEDRCAGHGPTLTHIEKAFAELRLDFKESTLKINQAIETLQAKPAKRWELVVEVSITAVISVIIGVIIGNLI